MRGGAGTGSVTAAPAARRDRTVANRVRLVVAQLLCKRIPKGRCAVHEILLQHEALPNTIRSGQIGNIKSIIESGGADGMVTMDTSLLNLIKDGTIEAKEAYMKAANKAAFAGMLKPGDLDGGH